MQPNSKVRIYLAGPDVFRKAPHRYGIWLKLLCQEHDAEGLWPFDNEADFSDPEVAEKIRLANEAMIRQADAVVANIDPFRGPNMDPGTAYEIGFARALGKPVYLYMNTGDGTASTLRERTENTRMFWQRWFDRFEDVYPNVEDFGLEENLMICSNSDVFTCPAFAIRAAARGAR